MAFLSSVSVATYAMNEYYIYLVAYLWFGFIYGMALQYGRFCFSSAFRDLFAVKVPRMAVGIMIAMVLFAFTAAVVNITGQSTFHPAPFGYFMLIGGFIFGVGTVFAGGCASGSLYKTGEGNGVAMIVLLSISVTQSIFVDVAGWTNKLVPRSWTESAAARGLPASISATDGWMDQYLAGYVWNRPAETVATALGWSDYSFVGAFLGNFVFGTVIPAALLLAVVYIWLSDKTAGRGTVGVTDHLAAFWFMIVASKRTAIAGIVLGVACGLQSFVMKGLQIRFGVDNFGELMQRMGITFGLTVNGTVFDPGYWYITTQEAQWVGWTLHKLGWENLDNIFYGLDNGIPNPLFNPADWMTVALIGGAAVMALLNNEFKWKKPTMELAFWAILGGAFMGIGARLALGCNVGAFFIRVPHGNYTGWLFGLGMIAGAFIGVKVLNWHTERKIARELEAIHLS
ncbi:MAG: YeeE/YedE family protein [Acidobacteria bacterium]|nr:YeeE/YedE family protein [Acidobacteriota bacterium]